MSLFPEYVLLDSSKAFSVSSPSPPCYRLLFATPAFLAVMAAMLVVLSASWSD
jgi:hypothetical protein